MQRALNKDQIAPKMDMGFQIQVWAYAQNCRRY